MYFSFQNSTLWLEINKNKINGDANSLIFPGDYAPWQGQYLYIIMKCDIKLEKMKILYEIIFKKRFNCRKVIQKGSETPQSILTDVKKLSQKKKMTCLKIKV